jgi:uncharacterized paraquat-inducible protein A
VRFAYVWPFWALVNLTAFGLALFLPLIKLSHFYVFENEVVLIQLPVVLFKNDEALLAVVVGTVGILVPVLKTVMFCAAPWRPEIARVVGALAPLSFFDIFMAALLIFIAKGAVATEAATAVGVYPMVFFAISTKVMEWRFSRASRTVAATTP